ncbi:MAG: hypothetical protein HKN25_11710 [Pyrinomonadaceae bacterium]|nr:hypothetical protein [Pyrinomonadaceae bacterium]
MKNFSNTLILLVFCLLVISCSLSRFTDREASPDITEKPAEQEEQEIKIADEEIVFDDSETSPITKLEYNRIEKGMTYPEVVKILKRKGELLNSSMVGAYKLETFRWKGDAKFSFIKCTFRNGFLTIKDESNLR